jgi:fibronectin-binding autotransporter adhesin
MDDLQGMGAPTREIGDFRFKPCAIAFTVALALGLSGCGGGGGANVKPTPSTPPPASGTGFAGGEIVVGAHDVTVLPDDIGGSIDLIKGGTGTLVLTGTDTYTGGTTINLGTLQIGNGGTTGSIIGDVIDNGSLVFNRSDDVTFNGIVSGSGSLEQAGKGSLILAGTNTYTGGTTISNGTLQLGNGGSTGSIAGDVINNGSLVFDRSDDVIFNGIVSGSGSLEQAGKGSLILVGTNTYTGGTRISSGTLQLGNGGTAGSIVGDVIDNGSLVFNRSDDVTFNGIVSDSGALEQAGTGTLTLTGANTYTGDTTISHGTLRLGNGGTSGSIMGGIQQNGMLVFDRSDDVDFAGPITGTGSLTKTGGGVLTLAGTNGYTGTTQVISGSLYVDGNQSESTGATIVASGATLGGMGILGGDLAVANGAILAPGGKSAIGTLIVNGNLNLSASSMLDYGFGQATTGSAQLSDLINIKGNLTLDGTVNVSVASGDDLGPGAHRLFNYHGTLIDNGLTLGSIPSSGWVVQTGVAEQVNLVNTQGMIFSFWDGDAGPKGNNTINGGNGTWENGSLLSNNNWADASGAVNGTFSDRSFAVFEATPGKIDVANGNGDVKTAGMQFANDGYVVQGDAILLVGSVDDPAHSIIRVGDGTAAGASYKAAINNVLTGNTGLLKTDAGTLVLGNANTYTGATVISGGTLQIGNGGTTGSVMGDVANNATLTFNRSDDVTFNGIVSGSGLLMQSGPGKLTLTGTSTHTGGTTVTGGVLEIVAGATLGSGTITVGVDNLSLHSLYTLQVGPGASLSNRVVLKGFASLDNAGALGGNVDFGVEGDSNLEGANSAAGRSSRILNHDGGTIRGNNAGVMFYGYLNAVENIGGGIIEGGDIGIGMGHGGSVLNDGVGSTILSSGIAIQSTVGGGVENRGGGIITGDAAAVDLKDGGFVHNDGTGSTISSPAGTAIRFDLGSGEVSNSGGATITSGSTAIHLQNGGSVSNGPGSTIETTGTTGGDCASIGDCAIFVASDSQAPGSIGGELKLANAGNIVGNVQLNPTALNDVTLWTGSSIQGNLDIGSNQGALLTLAGDAASAQSYSQAVTDSTTFVGSLYKKDAGTWVLDDNSLTPNTIQVDGGTLQIGKGGTEGFIGASHIALHGGALVFDRSDDVVLDSDIDGYQQTSGGALVQAGTGILTLMLTNHQVSISDTVIESGILQLDNTGGMPSQAGHNQIFQANLVNDGLLIANSNASLHYTGEISGTGSVAQNGSGTLILEATNTYTGDTTINNGTLLSLEALPGNVVVNTAGTLDGYSLSGQYPGVPRVAHNLSNAGRVAVHGGDSIIGGNYVQSPTGTLAVNLGSKLDVTFMATLDGGILEVTGADNGFVSNTHTEVLTTGVGIHGTFDQLVKGTGVVFTATTINYDANSVWLDTTGLNVTTAAAGNGVSYTAASMGSALRVQGAFEQLNGKIATGNLADVSGNFLQAAGQFQQSPTLLAAQASLQSLSGQLHADSAAMTFRAIDASSRALSDRFDNLLDKGAGFGMWTHNLSVGGDMTRVGFDSVGFQLNGWLVGSDRRIGQSGVAGFAFGQSQGQQRLDQGYDHDNSRSTEGMLYAGWLNGNWYTQGRIGFGHSRQDVSRQILLGNSAQGVRTQYNGSYDVAYGESGLHFGHGNNHVAPFVNVEYARVDRGDFAEQGAGGFGLRSNAQTLDRWQAGLGVRAGHHWVLKGGGTVDFSARAQWQRTLASHGDVFDASFVGLQQWQPLVGIGLSRYSGLLGIGLDATLSTQTTLKFGYDYEMGQSDHAQMLSARLHMAF